MRRATTRWQPARSVSVFSCVLFMVSGVARWPLLQGALARDKLAKTRPGYIGSHIFRRVGGPGLPSPGRLPKAVQTCLIRHNKTASARLAHEPFGRTADGHHDARIGSGGFGSPRGHRGGVTRDRVGRGRDRQCGGNEIGRASCRERGENWVGGGGRKTK